jgi:hypothetical protein
MTRVLCVKKAPCGACVSLASIMIIWFLKRDLAKWAKVVKDGDSQLNVWTPEHS